MIDRQLGDTKLIFDLLAAFIGPLAAQSFLSMTTWRWAYGAFGFIMPFVFCPLAFVFKYYEKQAEKRGIIRKTASGRTMGQSIMHYIHEFDGKPFNSSHIAFPVLLCVVTTTTSC